MAMDAMMAGVDTTGGAATFLIYHLASNPDKQEKLYNEIVNIIGTNASDQITESKLKKMKYLRACCQVRIIMFFKILHNLSLYTRRVTGASQ